MKRIIVCLIGFLISTDISAHNLEEVIAKTLPSITYIEVERMAIATTVDPATSTITQFKTRQSPVIGTGFVVQNNKVITNYHVIQPSFEHDTAINVMFHNDLGRKYVAKVLGYDEIADVAVLEIEGTHPSLTFAPNAGALKMGAEVFTISNFFGMQFSTTVGIISSNDRMDGRFPYIRLLQLQILQGSGSSGGPVLDVNGQVVSINHSIMSMSPDSMLNNPSPSLLSVLAYTIRGDQVSASINKILREGIINRVDLGVQLESYGVTSERFLYNPVPNSNGIAGVLITAIEKQDSPLNRYDIILSVGSTTFTNSAQFLLWLDENYDPGQEVNIQVYRDGSVINITTKLELAHRELE